MDLNQLQNQVDTWIRTHDDYWTDFQILARLTEELGEVAGALQRQSGLRPRKHDVDLAAEVGDLLFTLAAFANRTGIDLDQAIASTFAKYDARDAQAWHAHNQDQPRESRRKS